jgi:hypothetical protein
MAHVPAGHDADAPVQRVRRGGNVQTSRTGFPFWRLNNHTFYNLFPGRNPFVPFPAF